MIHEDRMSENDCLTLYSRPIQAKLPENYTLRNGFLYKGNTVVSLETAGIIEAARQGFLHVDETPDYQTG